MSRKSKTKIGKGFIINDECLNSLKKMDDDIFSSVVTDPPYALKFMGKGWDKVLPSVEVWKECLRVCKPGAVLLAFGGTRTFHRLACVIEDAGWILRDTIMWVYGSGFPKSLNIGKAIDNLQGNERVTTGKEKVDIGIQGGSMHAGRSSKVEERDTTSGNTGWDGYGTVLKPAWEPIIIAMKPLDGTFAKNALKWGVAGLNVDGCRIGTEERTYKGSGAQPHKLNAHEKGDTGIGYMDGIGKDKVFKAEGRFPANLIHDGSDEVVGLFPNSKGWASQKHNSFNPYGGNAFSKSETERDGYHEGFNDFGSAARFFYCAKASRSERGEGNNHPTVKPLKLIQYLCNLVKMPEKNFILDPFAGSGTTAIACESLNMKWLMIEMEKEYCRIIKARIEGQERDKKEKSSLDLFFNTEKECD